MSNTASVHSIRRTTRRSPVAGRVASKGIEAALAIRPVDRWKFWTNVAFVKARYLDFQLVDSVQLGLVDSFARPGGNATGVNMLITAVEAKRLGLLHEFAPFATRIAILEPISKLLVRLQSAINVR
jgi:hypothetical protein